MFFSSSRFPKTELAKQQLHFCALRGEASVGWLDMLDSIIQLAVYTAYIPGIVLAFLGDKTQIPANLLPEPK